MRAVIASTVLLSTIFSVAQGVKQCYSGTETYAKPKDCWSDSYSCFRAIDGQSMVLGCIAHYDCNANRLKSGYTPVAQNRKMNILTMKVFCCHTENCNTPNFPTATTASPPMIYADSPIINADVPINAEPPSDSNADSDSASSIAPSLNRSSTDLPSARLTTLTPSTDSPANSSSRPSILSLLSALIVIPAYFLH